MALQHLTKQNYAEFARTNEVAIVDFWAEWCGPCRMLTPVLEQFNFQTGIAVGKVNVDEEEGLAATFGVEAIPTLLLYKNGKLVGKKIGYVGEQILKDWVK